MKNEKEIRSQIVAYSQKAYNQGFIAGTSGNLSVRLDASRIVVTQSGFNKGSLSENNLLVYDIQKGQVRGKTPVKPSSEIRMHTFVYQNRSEINAVIHAHPPYAVALSVAGISLENVVLPESILTIGTIVDCGYATPTTEEVVNVMKPVIQDGHNAIMLARHGSVTTGKTLEEAFNHLETLEYVAKVTAIAKSVGSVTGLPQKEINKL